MIDNYLNELSRATRANGSKNCPNCGAPIETEKCPYCGTVFVDFAAMNTDRPFFMKIKYNGKVHIMKVMLTSMETRCECSELYADNVRYLTLIPTTELTMTFDILS